MRRVTSFLLTGLMLLGATTAAAQADAIRWAPNLDAALNMASRQNRLVLIHFSSDNCPPCRSLEANVYSRQDVARAIEETFIPVKINVDRFPETVRRYGVESWPTDVVVTPNGNVVNKSGCPQDGQQYVGRLLAVASSTGRTRMVAQRSGSPYGSPTTQPGQPQLPPRGAALPPFAGTRQPNGSTQQTPIASNGGAQFSRFGSRGTTPQPPTNQFSGQPATTRQPIGNPYQAQAPAAPNSAYAPNGAGSRFGATQPPAGRTAAPNTPPNATPRWGGNTTPAPQQPVASQPTQRTYNNPPASRYGQPMTQPATNPGNSNPYVAATQPRTPIQQRPPIQPPAAQPPRSNPQPINPLAAKLPPGSPPLGLDGYCPMTLAGGQQWQQGDIRWGAIHHSRTYLFASESKRDAFLKKPDQFAPVLSGDDPVSFAEQGQHVSGKRQHGVFYRNQIFLFSSEESLQRFWKSPQNYADAVYQAMKGTPATRR